MKNRFNNIKVIFFDTSDTLYKNAELEAAYSTKLVELIAKTCNLSIKEAANQLKQNTERLKKPKNTLPKLEQLQSLE